MASRTKKVNGKKKASQKKKRRPNRFALKPIQPNVAGIDVGAKEHWVAGPQREDGQANVERFGTTTAELERIAQWLLDQGVTSVALESTGVYWIPLVETLEARGIDAVIANARQAKHLPGRKTDMLDCQWLQLLHAHGLLHGSFRPSQAFCELRELSRMRETLVRERADWIRRMQKALDHMNVRVHRAVSDITGVTGMKMLRAIVAGERDPQQLAACRDGRCAKTAEEIAEYLRGTWRREHLFNLCVGVRLYDVLTEIIAEYEKTILQWMNDMLTDAQRATDVPAHRLEQKNKAIRAHGHAPWREALYRLCGVDLTGIDGVAVETAMTVVVEVGVDMSRFPTERAFASYLTLAPDTKISGGRPLAGRRSSKTCARVGQALRMAASGLQNSKSALGAAFRRLASRKGRAVAVFAMARKIAILIYRLLRHGQEYVDIGMEAYKARYRQRRIHAAENTLKELGFTVLPPNTCVASG